MDWSLVLISQGIETMIQPPTDEFGWALSINVNDYQLATDAIQKYSAENRGWAWSRQRVAPGLHFDWTSAVWILLLVFCFWLSVERPDVERAGIFNSVAVKQGEWWRIFTATMLHADLKHLASNCSIGLLLFGLTMGFYGTGNGLLAAFLAGAGGNLIALLAYSTHMGLGASGMVFGSLGLMATQWFVLARKNPGGRKVIFSGFICAIFLLVLFGFSPETDIVAHLGGFATGIFLGGIFAFIPASWRRNAVVNSTSGILLGGLIILCWFLALHTQQLFSLSPVK